MFCIKCSQFTLIIYIFVLNKFLLNIYTNAESQQTERAEGNITHKESGNIVTLLFGTDDILTNVSNNVNGINESLNTFNKSVEQKFDGIQNEIDDIKNSAAFIKNYMDNLRDSLQTLSSTLQAKLSENTNTLLKQINQVQDNIQQSATALSANLAAKLNNQNAKQSEISQQFRNSFICADIYSSVTARKPEVYNIYVAGLPPFPALCMPDIADRCAWTAVQQRLSNTVSFDRDWKSYKEGFGELRSNFFIGLDKLHALTHATPMTLCVTVSYSTAIGTQYAYYDSFAIGDESSSYVLHTLGAYSGTAGDCLTNYKGHKFYTKDRDNSKACAAKYNGGWWYSDCRISNLNGLYAPGIKQLADKAIHWCANYQYDYPYSLEFAQIAVRPRDCVA